MATNWTLLRIKGLKELKKQREEREEELIFN